MQSNGRTYYSLDEANDLKAIAIHCSDPRWRKVFEEFLEHELGLDNYALIAVPGSISSVSVEMTMPKRLKVLKDYLKFMIRHGKNPRLVIINHEGCRMYGSLQHLLRMAINQQQVEDLKSAVTLFKKIFPSLIDIEIYMAKVDPAQTTNSVYFEKVTV